MEQKKSQGCWNATWNGLAIIAFFLSVIIAAYAFFVSTETNIWLRAGSLLVATFTAFYTTYQVWRSQDSFPLYLQHELSALFKAIGGAAQWIVNRIQEITKQQTEEIKSHQAEGFSSLEKKIDEQHKKQSISGGYSSQQHQEADIRLFKKLWEHLKHFEDEITWLLQFESIEKTRYKAVVGSYIELRERKENSFIHKDIEETFKALDKKLNDFESERVVLTGSDRIPLDSKDGPMMIVSNYKYMRLKGPDYNQSYEEFDRIADVKGEEWNEFSEKFDEINQQITEIVKMVKTILPEIEFD